MQSSSLTPCARFWKHVGVLVRNTIALFLVWPRFIPHFLSVSDTYAKSAPSPTPPLLHEADYTWKRYVSHTGGESWPHAGKWYFCISQNDIKKSLGMSAQCDMITFQRCPWNKLLHGPTGLCSKSSTHTCTHTHKQMRSDKHLLPQSRAPRPHTFFFFSTQGAR